MASLILTNDILRVTLVSKRLEVIKRVVDKDGEHNESTMVPLFDVERVMIVGHPHVSMHALTRLMDMGIHVVFLSSRGRWRGAVTSDNNLNAERRIKQYEMGTEPEFSLRVARKLIYAKLRNQRRILQRLAANRKMTSDAEHLTVTELLKNLSEQVLEAPSVDVVRGYEGLGAASYFGRLSAYFPKTMPFENRNRRPPKDPANALLSWAYTVLLGEVEAAVRKHGLDAAIGNLHDNRITAPSLALDLIEPLRPAVADLLVMNLVNHYIVKTEDHFEYNPEDGGIYLNAEGRKSFFILYEQTITRRFAIAPGEEHTDYRKVIDSQVCEYLRAIEQNKDPEFFLLP